MEQFEGSWTSFYSRYGTLLGPERFLAFFFTILLTSSIEGAARLNGHVGRGASEIPVL